VPVAVQKSAEKYPLAICTVNRRVSNMIYQAALRQRAYTTNQFGFLVCEKGNPKEWSLARGTKIRGDDKKYLCHISPYLGSTAHRPCCICTKISPHLRVSPPFFARIGLFGSKKQSKPKDQLILKIKPLVEDSLVVSSINQSTIVWFIRTMTDVYDAVYDAVKKQGFDIEPAIIPALLPLGDVMSRLTNTQIKPQVIREHISQIYRGKRLNINIKNIDFKQQMLQMINEQGLPAEGLKQPVYFDILKLVAPTECLSRSALSAALKANGIVKMTKSLTEAYSKHTNIAFARLRAEYAKKSS
jgi:hypothetical protein